MFRKSFWHSIDWWLVAALAAICGWGLLSLNSFSSEGAGALFDKQLIWLSLAWAVFLVASFFDFRFLRNSKLLFLSYVGIIVLLLALFALGSAAGGAQSWFDLGGFSFQPAELAKLVVILVLAKYFSKRHIQIADFRHILVSGSYVVVIFALVFVQPDLGSAVIIFLVWFGMVLLAGLNWKHLFLMVGAGAVVAVLAWNFALADYQKTRVLTFVNPAVDLAGAGYNSNQAKIAVGSGGLIGKGVGYGTQARLDFLPESETDFIFSAFAEEWGFVGSVVLLVLYGIVVFRIIRLGMYGESNFEMLFAGGVVVLIMAHVFVHVGINIGLLPVTGTTIPFMSYGGSHLIVEFLALGMVVGMSRRQRTIHRSDMQGEFLGL